MAIQGKTTEILEQLAVGPLLLIDNKWVGARDGATFNRLSPYDGSIVGTYADATQDDIVAAIQSARQAFDSGEWRNTSTRDRAGVLMRVATSIRANVDALTAMVIREVGQPGQRGMVLRAAETLDYYAHLITDRRDEMVGDQDPNAIGLIVKEPVGAVGVLTNWNSPMSLAHKGCPALAAGCSVVLKPSHLTPGTALVIGRFFVEAGLPPGVLNIVTSARDDGVMAGQTMASSPLLDMIAFTGSTVNGRKVMAACAANLTRVSLELGGKSPHIIFPDVRSIDEAVDAAFLGITTLAGQACQSGSRLLVHESIRAEVVAKLKQKFEAVRLGNPLDPVTTMGPMVSAAHQERVISYIENGKRGAQLVTGGGRPASAALAGGHFVQPTLFDGVDNHALIAREEIFGPVLAVMSFHDEAEAVNLANDTMFGLAAGVWTEDIRVALRVAKAIRSGTVWVNAFRESGLWTMPAGGFKQSGIGRERGREGLDVFLETKSIHLRY